jgi:hypothetical protein
VRLILAILVGIGLGIRQSAASISPSIATSNPFGAWTLLERVGVGRGNSIFYVPVASDYVGATVEGLVVKPELGWSSGEISSTPDEDTIRVFTTYASSSVAINIPLSFGGDDGTSLYVDGVFAGGGGFDVQTTVNLSLLPGTFVRLDLAVYNGPGVFVVNVRRQGDNVAIENIPNVFITADTLVPEPGLMGVVGLGLMMLRSRGKTRKPFHVRIGCSVANCSK